MIVLVNSAINGARVSTLIDCSAGAIEVGIGGGRLANPSDGIPCNTNLAVL